MPFCSQANHHMRMSPWVQERAASLAVLKLELCLFKARTSLQEAQDFWKIITSLWSVLRCQAAKSSMSRHSPVQHLTITTWHRCIYTIWSHACASVGFGTSQGCHLAGMIITVIFRLSHWPEYPGYSNQIKQITPWLHTFLDPFPTYWIIIKIMLLMEISGWWTMILVLPNE